jgi:hypothetical protein
VALVDVLSTKETKRKVEAVGSKAICIEANLISVDCVDDIVNKTVEVFGEINILCNNAGIIRRSPIGEFSEKDWENGKPYIPQQKFYNEMRPWADRTFTLLLSRRIKASVQAGPVPGNRLEKNCQIDW